MLEKGHEAMTRKRAQKIVSTRGEAFFSDMELTERMKEHATFCALMIYLLFFFCRCYIITSKRTRLQLFHPSNEQKHMFTNVFLK